MIKVLNHPIVQHNLAIMRDEKTGRAEFRRAGDIISMFLAHAAFEDLQTENVNVKTPMETTVCKKISNDVVLVPVFRAGLGLLEGFRKIYPDSVTAFVGMRRNEQTAIAEEYYFNCPEFNKGAHFIVLEIMIATGGTTTAAVSRLQLEGAENITVCSIISAPEGIETLRAECPNVRVITAALDRELNAKKYILPGLGDAGDRWS